VLVVTTPEPTAITDAYAVVKVLTREGAQQRISLLVNQARSAAEAKVVYDRISKVARQFLGVSLLEAGHVLSDEQVPTAVRRRVPFVLGSPRCAASQCIAQLAMRLERGVAGAMAGGANAGGGSGFFSRMGRWFRK
jgi:flagellar biosynthesis protein FlhG